MLQLVKMNPKLRQIVTVHRNHLPVLDAGMSIKSFSIMFLSFAIVVYGSWGRESLNCITPYSPKPLPLLQLMYNCSCIATNHSHEKSRCPNRATYSGGICHECRYTDG
jgi:hypothetical protein